MRSMLFLLFLLLLSQTNGKFVLNADSSAIIVLRHIRLSTDEEHYRIRCPYRFNHLTVTLLNYSSENCFQLHTKPTRDICTQYQSPCRFHAKSIQLDCPDHPHSKHVDVTYQCSFSSASVSARTTRPSTDDTTSVPLLLEDESITLHALSFPSGVDESLGIFLIALTTVFLLWLTICCVWFVRCDRRREDDDSKCELLSFRPYPKADVIDFPILTDPKAMIVGNLSGQTSTGGLDNVCLHLNPLENKRLSSLNIPKHKSIDNRKSLCNTSR